MVVGVVVVVVVVVCTKMWCRFLSVYVYVFLVAVLVSDTRARVHPCAYTQRENERVIMMNRIIKHCLPVREMFLYWFFHFHLTIFSCQF